MLYLIFHLVSAECSTALLRRVKGFAISLYPWCDRIEQLLWPDHSTTHLLTGSAEHPPFVVDFPYTMYHVKCV